MFHAFVVSADKTRVTLLRKPALAADTPNAHAPRALHVWLCGDADFARDREIIRAFNYFHPEEKGVPWTFAYVGLKFGTVERTMRIADAGRALGDLPHHVTVGWLEVPTNQPNGIFRHGLCSPPDNLTTSLYTSATYIPRMRR